MCVVNDWPDADLRIMKYIFKTKDCSVLRNVQHKTRTLAKIRTVHPPRMCAQDLHWPRISRALDESVNSRRSGLLNARNKYAINGWYLDSRKILKLRMLAFQKPAYRKNQSTSNFNNHPKTTGKHSKSYPKSFIWDKQKHSAILMRLSVSTYQEREALRTSRSPGRAFSLVCSWWLFSHRRVGLCPRGTLERWPRPSAIARDSDPRLPESLLRSLRPKNNTSAWCILKCQLRKCFWISPSPGRAFSQVWPWLSSSHRRAGPCAHPIAIAQDSDPPLPGSPSHFLQPKNNKSAWCGLTNQLRKCLCTSRSLGRSFYQLRSGLLCALLHP